MYHHAAIVVVTTAVATAECRISQLKLIITVPLTHVQLRINLAGKTSLYKWGSQQRLKLVQMILS
uniref:Uncharacterized protein n=1 Tax=Solanum lycopersicum TaxID=4081 RepID=A0A3Q7I443_SOLLC